MPENWNIVPSFAPSTLTWDSYGYGNSSSAQVRDVKPSTKVVELQAGHIGQVIVGGVIVKELKPRKTRAKALNAVNAFVARRAAELYR